ncbi:MAG: hypothetical protein KBC27_02765 [Rickettsiales bacterium]|nr:hypothetical protein [Rickettsiales bacterium]
MFNVQCKIMLDEEEQMLLRSKKIYGIGKDAKKIAPVSAFFLIVLGILFSVLPIKMLLTEYFASEVFALLGLGAAFCVWGLYLIFRKDRLNC